MKKPTFDRTGTPSELSTSPKSTPLSPSSDYAIDHGQKKPSLASHLFDSFLTRTASKPLTIKTLQRKSPTRSSSSSCPPDSFLAPSQQVPEQARCLYNYNPLKDDEVGARRGEFVQVLTYHDDNRWFVRRDAHRSTPMGTGWLPGYVLGMKTPNSASRTNSNHLTPPAVTPPSLSSNSLFEL